MKNIFINHLLKFGMMKLIFIIHLSKTEMMKLIFIIHLFWWFGGIVFATGVVLDGWGVTPSVGDVDRVCGAGFGAYTGVVRGRTIAIWHTSGVWVGVCVTIILGGSCDRWGVAGRYLVGLGGMRVWGVWGYHQQKNQHMHVAATRPVASFAYRRTTLIFSHLVSSHLFVRPQVNPWKIHSPPVPRSRFVLNRGRVLGPSMHVPT
jgi:hypothetical protein